LNISREGESTTSLGNPKNGKLLSTDEEKAEVLNNIFDSVFTGSLSPHHFPADGLQDGNQR